MENEEDYEETEFDRLDLPDPLLDAIEDLGFTACTPVQSEVLPHALDGEDIIAQAQTGTGKTAAFLISILTYNLENPETQKRKSGVPFALIIAPTRELAMQISVDAQDLAKYTSLSIVTVVGGLDYEKQQRALAGPVDLVVATPGRLLDFCRSGKVDLSHVEILILDEADRMLSMGFIPDVKAIVRRTPHKDKRQTQLFSATFSEDIKRLAVSWTQDATWISIDPGQIAVDSVTQLAYMVSEDQKERVIYNLITQQQLERIIIFVNRRDHTRDLESHLRRMGINTGLLTGEVPQRKRIRVLDDFKSGKLTALVATDVAGRGIHVDSISHVINFNLPEDPEDYIHRIGRTGRAGAQGISISLVCENDVFLLPQIEQMLGEPLDCVHPPEELLADAPEPAPRSREEMAERSSRGRAKQKRRR